MLALTSSDGEELVSSVDLISCGTQRRLVVPRVGVVSTDTRTPSQLRTIVIVDVVSCAPCYGQYARLFGCLCWCLLPQPALKATEVARPVKRVVDSVPEEDEEEDDDDDEDDGHDHDHGSSSNKNLESGAGNANSGDDDMFGDW